MSTSKKYRCLFCLTFAITLLQLGLTAPLPTDSGKATEEGGGLTLGSILPHVKSSTSTPASTTSPLLASTQLKTTSSPTSDAAKMTTAPLTKAWNPRDLVKPASLVRGARYQTEDGKESKGKGKAAHPELVRRPYAGAVGFRRRRVGIDHPLHRGVMSERELKWSLLELEAIRNGERSRETKEPPRQHRSEKDNEEFPVHSHGWKQEYEMPPVKPMDSKFVAHKIPYGRQGQQPIFYGHVGKPSRTPEFREEMLHDFWPKKHMQEENA
ncbi:unnamed protein product, partial [Dibothriocephalus latus]